MRFYKIIYCIVIPFFRLFYRTHVTGRENIPEGPVVVCGNHTSLTDPFFMAIAMGRHRLPVFMSKIELFRIPVVGFVLRRIKAIPVDRGASDLSAIKTAITELKAGNKIGIFPEGTRVDGNEASVDAAKTGAAMIASRAGVDMVPVYISSKKHIFGRVNVMVGKPVSLDSFEGTGSSKYKKVISCVFEEILRMGEEGEKNA